jgi:hypothetical protein
MERVESRFSWLYDQIILLLTDELAHFIQGSSSVMDASDIIGGKIKPARKGLIDAEHQSEAQPKAIRESKSLDFS